MDQHLGMLKSTWTEVNELRIHVLVSVAPMPPGTPVVVLVHGSGLSGRYMIPTAERLAADYPVYVPDLPGFGDSDKPSRVFDVSELADWLAG
jgi:2-hydroxy-6-oxonona-2,4-dienedioate hydrolase